MTSGGLLGPTGLVDAAREALLLGVAVSLPVVAIVALAGLVVAGLQAASQVQDGSVSHLPRLLAVAAALVILGPWMGHQIGVFAERMFLMAAAK
jgi:flagellar biosynthesis protein FliQ